MLQTKKIKAEIIEIISQECKHSIIRDYQSEELADRYSEYRYPEERRNSYYAYTEWEHNDNLDDYARTHREFFVKRNDLTGEKELYREFTFYSLKMKISYIVSNVKYEKQIELECATGNIRKIFVVCEKRNPENVLEIKYR